MVKRNIYIFSQVGADPLEAFGGIGTLTYTRLIMSIAMVCMFFLPKISIGLERIPRASNLTYPSELVDGGRCGLISLVLLGILAKYPQSGLERNIYEPVDKLRFCRISWN